MFDQALQRRIVAALDANPRVDDDEIAVECFDGGHVVLRGRAESPDKSTQAVRTASGVPGVRTVDDQLGLRRRGTSHRADARTEAAVLNAFIEPIGEAGADRETGADQLTVSTHHNVVTLSGTVRSAADRDAAVAAAASADWVVDVEDKIRVA
ncbi:MAG: BON domain-containing protein [Actinomycetota bacterium]|nr:BON domain-containing protein [Actinomycetota bacterium]